MSPSIVWTYIKPVCAHIEKKELQSAEQWDITNLISCFLVQPTYVYLPKNNMWGMKIIIAILNFISVKSQTLDELKNNPYNYYMFENFEMCKEVYKMESLELVPKIQLIRNMLEQRKKIIENYLESKEIINNLNNLRSKQWEEEQGITPEANKTYFPTDQDYEGATLGLVRLVRTYQVNLTLLSDHGLVQYQGTTTNQKMFNSYERLSAIDYMALAMKAQNFKMFDVAIEFSREILRLLPKETGNIMVPDIVRQSFDKMRHDLVTLNNQYLMKTKMIEGRYNQGLYE